MKSISVLFFLFSLPLFAAPNVVEFQKFKEETSMRVGSDELKLINLNKHIGNWFLITRTVPKQNPVTINFQVNDQVVKSVTLVPEVPTGVLLETTKGEKIQCPIFDTDVVKKHQKKGFEDICESLVSLRFEQSVAFTWSSKEMLDKSRKFASAIGLAETGEEIAGYGKAFLNWFSDPSVKEKVEDGDAKETVAKQGPPSARVQKPGTTIGRSSLGIELDETVVKKGEPLVAGQWYPTKNYPGAYVSMMTPDMVPADILASFPDRVGALTAEERAAAVVTVAFDMSTYSFGWTRGKDDPNLEGAWSPMQWQAKTNEPGPDGFARFAPLITPGYVPSSYLSSTVAVFSGGFHRQHSFFQYGERATTNKGNNYGFMEDGVLLSTLHHGLASFIVYKNGDVAIHPWSQEDDNNIANIRHVRQNGIAPTEYDPETKTVIPSEFSKDSKLSNYWALLNSLEFQPRGIAFTMENNGRKFVAYAFFTRTKPNAFARVLQAYHATGSVHLDMNSAYNAYFSMVKILNDDFTVENLITEMAGGNRGINMDGKNKKVPRFLAVPDSRDFFYVYKRR